MITKTYCPYCKQPLYVWMGKAARCAICKGIIFVAPKSNKKRTSHTTGQTPSNMC